MKFLSKTKTGILSFYALCAIVASLFYFFQVDLIRVSNAFTPDITSKGYLESLNFGGIKYIVIFVLLEIIVLYFQKKKHPYDVGDSMASVGVYLINIFATPITLLYLYSLLKYVEHFALFQIGDGLFPFVITVVLFEGAYYWYHRVSHESPFLWSIHHTHHSAQSLNLSIAFRLHTFGRIFSPIVYLPMIIMGFKPEYIMAGLVMSLIYQFFLHTQTIPKLGWFEHIGFNTPSKHRVHHGANKYCIDKNYGGMLMIWDLIHRTYTPESAPIKYGVTTGFYSYNPLKILFKPQIDWYKGDFKREKELKEPNFEHINMFKISDNNGS